MPAVGLHNGLCSGHGCHPPRHNITASENFFFSNRGVIRVDDTWENHTCGENTHNGIQVGGSGNFYVNNKPVARIGDAISCGSVVADGSPSAYVN